MLKKATLLTAALLLTGTTASASDIGTSRTLGVGLGGATTASGISGKLYLSPASAVQAVVGSGYSGAGLHLSADYMQELGELDAPTGDFRVFYAGGFGAGIASYNSYSAIGVSGVLELGFHMKQYPIELTLDWRPSFFMGDYLNGLYLGHGGGAIRYYL